jgi:hypothetical protein
LVLKNNGAMVSTVEKLRAGTPVGGMSPEADMDTGGATYFFTRIRKLPTAGGSRETGLYFKKRHVPNHRGSTPAKWKKFARRSNNKTIFKYSVTLLNNIDVIVVGSEREKRRLLDVFRKRRISRLPDGRKVEDIILVR